jgi:eukaryotic-like serine/threonine-protein kinase
VLRHAGGRASLPGMTLTEKLERLLRFALLAFVLAAAAFLSAVTTIRLAIRGRVVAMPNVVGKPLPEAQQILQAGGLQIRVADRMYNPLPANAVLRQSPAPGDQVKLSQTAQVVLSLGPQSISVPSVEGRSLRGARITLLESGLELGELSTMYLPVPQADTVLAQDPAKGAPANSPRVDVLVAAGERPTEYVMPTLTGLDQAGAERILAAAGIRGTRVTYTTQSGAPAGTVVGQTPPRGSRFSGEGPVELSVAQ